MTAKSVKSILAFVSIGYFIINKCGAQSYNQRVTLYSGQNGNDRCISLTESYATSLKIRNFDNIAYSACVTGVWLFYDNENFNNIPGSMEYIFGTESYCTNLTRLGGRVSSIRFAGYPRNYKKNSLTMYQNEYYQGAEQLTFIDLKTVSMERNMSSLIITGNSPWTLYALPNYLGDSVCIYPQESVDFHPAFIHDLATINTEISVRSVRLGCYGEVYVVSTAL